jgi:hypothetical protein
MSNQRSDNAILADHAEELWAVMEELIEWDAFVMGGPSEGRAWQRARKLRDEISERLSSSVPIVISQRQEDNDEPEDQVSGNVKYRIEAAATVCLTVSDAGSEAEALEKARAITANWDSYRISRDQDDLVLYFSNADDSLGIADVETDAGS